MFIYLVNSQAASTLITSNEQRVDNWQKNIYSCFDVLFVVYFDIAFILKNSNTGERVSGNFTRD